jgi:hypothetical protein
MTCQKLSKAQNHLGNEMWNKTIKESKKLQKTASGTA